ncbi:MAG: hypothetical protein HOP29_11190 [Phycisphaerales bacterium]|nr:hypothetical protein [Phycisphaerales bacterium]
MFTRKVRALRTVGVVGVLAATSAFARNIDVAGSSAARLLAQIAAVGRAIQQAESTLGSLNNELDQVNQEISELMTGGAGDVSEEQHVINLQTLAALHAEAAEIEGDIADVETEIAQLRQTYQSLRNLCAQLFGGMSGSGPTPDRI